MTEGVWGSGYIDPYFFFISAQVGGEWSVSHLGRFTLRYPLDRRLGGPHSPSEGREQEKILDPTGTITPTPRPSSP
jgi:hypothetical protein